MKQIKLSILVLFMAIAISIFPSCNKTSSSKSNQDAESVNIKTTAAYKEGYTHGKKGRDFGISDPLTYCESLCNMDTTVPCSPHEYWKKGFIDGYNNK